MSDRLSIGLLVAMAVCCGGPVLVGTGLAATFWGVLRGHWPWAVASLGVVLLVLALRIRRVRARRNIFFCASTHTPMGM